jgi:alanine racemase
MYGTFGPSVDWFGVALLKRESSCAPRVSETKFFVWVDFGRAGIRLPPVSVNAGDRPLDETEVFDRAARDAGIKANVHLKIDTGMGRLGVRSEKVSQFCEGLQRLANIRVEGVMTHLAAADDPALDAFTTIQLKRFEDGVRVCREHGIDRLCSRGKFGGDFRPFKAREIWAGGSLYGLS